MSDEAAPKHGRLGSGARGRPASGSARGAQPRAKATPQRLAAARKMFPEARLDDFKPVGGRGRSWRHKEPASSTCSTRPGAHGERPAQLRRRVLHVPVTAGSCGARGLDASTRRPGEIISGELRQSPGGGVRVVDARHRPRHAGRAAGMSWNRVAVWGDWGPATGARGSRDRAKAREERISAELQALTTEPARSSSPAGQAPIPRAGSPCTRSRAAPATREDGASTRCSSISAAVVGDKDCTCSAARAQKLGALEAGSPPGRERPRVSVGIRRRLKTLLPQGSRAVSPDPFPLTRFPNQPESRSPACAGAKTVNVTRARRRGRNHASRRAPRGSWGRKCGRLAALVFLGGRRRCYPQSFAYPPD